MEIKPHRLQTFKELCKKLYGIELSDRETYEKASLLLGYVRLCTKHPESTDSFQDLDM